MAPLGPTAPSPDNLIRLPSSTPAGMLTSSFLFFLVLPSPLQVPQGSVITWPAPPQAEHVLSTVKKPWDALVLPDPPQIPQFFKPFPFSEPEPWQESQRTSVSKDISFLIQILLFDNYKLKHLSRE